MFTSEIRVRVRYAETDRMGFVYHGNFATYFEVARVESMRELGLNYRALEDDGVLMPVAEMHTEFVRPAEYDDLLTIKTSIVAMPTARIRFEYETLNEAGERLNTGHTVLFFMDAESRRPRRAPDALVQALQNHFA